MPKNPPAAASTTTAVSRYNLTFGHFHIMRVRMTPGQFRALAPRLEEWHRTPGQISWYHTPIAVAIQERMARKHGIDHVLFINALDMIQIDGGQPEIIAVPGTLHPRAEEIGVWDIELLDRQYWFVTTSPTDRITTENWRALVAEFRDRNTKNHRYPPAAKDDTLARMPSDLMPVTRMFHSTYTTAEKFQAEHKAYVEQDRESPRVTVDLRRASGTPLQVHLPLSETQITEGSADKIADLCLARLSQLDTSTLVLFLGLVDYAIEHQNPYIGLGVKDDKAVPATYADLGRRLGILDVHRHKGKKPRKDVAEEVTIPKSTSVVNQLRTKLELLSDLRITIKQGAVSLEDVPILIRHATVKIDARTANNGAKRYAGTLLEIGPIFWNALTSQTRAILFDRAILTADTRRQEWDIRLYLYMSSRWALSWQGDGLYDTDGTMTHTLGTLLDRAGITYDLAHKGPAALRQKIDDVLVRLAASTWTDVKDTTPRPLIAAWQRTPGDTAADDRITVTPTDKLRTELNQLRPRAIAAAKRRAEAPQTTATTTRRRGRRRDA